MATPEQVLAFARSEAERQGVPVDLVQNIVRAESGGDINAVSPKGAVGPMQLMPSTAKDLGVNPNNWQQNVQGGVKYIGQMLSQFEDPRLAVAAYNAGPGNVRKYGDVPPFKETQNYVQKVVGPMDYEQLMKNSQPVGQAAQPQEGSSMSYEDLMKSSTPVTAQQQQQAPTKQSSFGLDVARGARDPIDALAQLLPRGLEAATSLGYTSPNRLSKFFGSEAQRVDEINRQAEQQYREAGGETINTGRVLGNVATGLVPGMYATKAAQLAAPASRLAQASIAGGVSSGLLTPVERTGDFAAEKGAQVLSGAVAGPLVDKIVGSFVSPAVTDAARKMQQLGVQLTPGQAFGGAVQGVENLISKLPIVGKTAREAQQRSLDQFNTGVINDALSSVGKKLPEGLRGREAIKYMDKTISNEYDKVLPKAHIPASDALFESFDSSLKQSSRVLPDRLKADLNKYFNDNVLGRFSNGQISGTDFKAIDSDLGKMIVNYGRGGGDDAMYADALASLRNTLRDNFKAINPKDAQIVDAANTAWAKKLRVEGAAGYLAGESGQFIPTQLQSATKALDSTARKGGFARGDALMQDVAEAGKASLGDTPVGSPNLIGLGSLGAGYGGVQAGFVDPALATILGGTALGGYTRPAQSVFNALMTSARPAVAPAVRQQLPGLLSPSATGAYLRDEQIPRIEMTGMAR